MPATTYGTLINSLNLYVDSSDATPAGDDMRLQLDGQALNVAEGQNLRVTVTEFSLHRPITTINGNNNKFRMTLSTLSAADQTFFLELTETNCHSVGTIVQDFHAQFRARMQAHTAIALSSSVSAADTAPSTSYVQPATGADATAVSNGIFKSRLRWPAGTDISDITNVRIQLIKEISDSYLLFGGDHVDDGSNDASMDFTLFDGGGVSEAYIEITGRYPMQLDTTPNVYLRTDLRNTGIQSAVLDFANGTHAHHTLSSNILAKIQMDPSQTVTTVRMQEHEYFINLQQRALSSMRLFLTDHAGRPLGRKANSTSKTASGTGLQQSTKGGLFFSAVLRIDTIQRTPPNVLKSKPVPQPIPQRRTGPAFVQNEILRDDD